jgi:nitrogen regulatory protein PII
MKKIEAIILSCHLNAVRAALEQRGISGGLTLMEVQWSEGQSGSVAGADSGPFQSRVKLELTVGDRQAQKALDVILRHAQLGLDQKNGHIVVLQINETLQIGPPTFETA